MGNYETWLLAALAFGWVLTCIAYSGANKRAREAQDALTAEIKAHDSTRETLRLLSTRPRKPPVKRSGIIEGQRK